MWSQSTASSTLCVLFLVAIYGVIGVQVEPNDDLDDVEFDGISMSYGDGWNDISFYQSHYSVPGLQTWRMAREDNYITEWPIQMTLTDNYQFTSGVSTLTYNPGVSTEWQSDNYLSIGDGTRYVTFGFDFGGGDVLAAHVGHNGWRVSMYPPRGGAFVQGDVANVLQGFESAPGDTVPFQLRNVLAGDTGDWDKLNLDTWSGENWPLTLKVTNNARDGVSSFEMECGKHYNTVSFSFTDAFAADTPITIGWVPQNTEDFRIYRIDVEMEIPLLHRGNLLSGKDTTCSVTENNCLAECEGDCDADSHCEDGLQCWMRAGTADDENIPFGCTGPAKTGIDDYCYDPAKKVVVDGNLPLVYRGNIVNGEGTECSDVDDNCLAECEGDCDSDYHCEDGLVCWHRDGDVPIPPGCYGTANSEATDYCNDPAKKVPNDEGKLPYVHRGHNHDARRVPLKECEGECDTDDNCDGILKCYHRNNDEVPGCYGQTHGSGDSSGGEKFDYCYDPNQAGFTSFFDFDYTVSLSMEDLMMIAMMVMNVALVVVLCMKCKTKHVHPAKYTPVMVVGDSEMEELQK